MSSQQQQLASIRDLLEQQQRRQETNWQQLLASSQRQEQLLLKLLERLDTAAPPAATAVPAGQQGEAPAAAEGGGGGLPVVAADDGLRLGEREQPAVASSTDGDAEACGQPAVGSGAGTAGTEGQQQQQRQVDESVPPRLLDYVRFREEVRIPRSSGEDSREDVIPAGAEGVVLASADGGTRLKVGAPSPDSGVVRLAPGMVYCRACTYGCGGFGVPRSLAVEHLMRYLTSSSAHSQQHCGLKRRRGARCGVHCIPAYQEARPVVARGMAPCRDSRRHCCVRGSPR